MYMQGEGRGHGAPCNRQARGREGGTTRWTRPHHLAWGGRHPSGREHEAWGDLLCHAARYDQYLLGVFPVGDLTEVVAAAGAEVVILEEPEHLTWYHHGPRWTERFDHVVRAPILPPCFVAGLPAAEQAGHMPLDAAPGLLMCMPLNSCLRGGPRPPC